MLISDAYMRTYVVLGIVIALLLGVGVGVYAITQQRSEVVKEVDLSEKLPEAEAKNDDVIKIAVSALISPKQTLSVYNEIFDYIGEKLGKRVELVQRKTYAEVNDLIKNQEVAAGFICSGPYVTGHDDFGMELLAAPRMYGDTIYYSYLVVNKESDITGMRDLRGKTFAFTDPNSNSGKIAPTYTLYQMGETPDSYFGKYTYSGGHDNSIEMVGKKIVDAVAVDHLIYRYLEKNDPNFVKNTKVVEQYGPFGIPPIAVHPSLDPELKTKLQNILLTMHEDPRGKHLLDEIMIEKFVTVDDALYDSVREMEAAVGTR